MIIIHSYIDTPSVIISDAQFWSADSDITKILLDVVQTVNYFADFSHNSSGYLYRAAPAFIIRL